MRILKLQEFLQVPKGTIFMKFEPHVFEELCVFEGSAGNIDFFYVPLEDAVDFDESGELFDKLDSAILDSSVSLKMDYDIVSRDGLYDEDQLFAILEGNDVEEILLKIFRSFLCGYNPPSGVQRDSVLSLGEFTRETFGTE